MGTSHAIYHRSFVGRDYKAWAQIALFIIAPYLTEEETAVWLLLSKVHKHISSNLHPQNPCRCSNLPTVNSTNRHRSRHTRVYANILSQQLLECSQPSQKSQRFTFCCTWWNACNNSAPHLGLTQKGQYIQVHVQSLNFPSLQM